MRYYKPYQCDFSACRAVVLESRRRFKVFDQLPLAKTPATTYATSKMEVSKQSLRRDIVRTRRNLSPEDFAVWSRKIQDRIRRLNAWKDAKAVLAYMPVRGEVDVTPLVQELWVRDARVLLPRCRPGEQGIMDVACPSGAHELAPGAYGIPEPHPDACPALRDCKPDLIIVPGVAFDATGRRLGLGGGYYDRLLAKDEYGKALLVAPAYDFQLVAHVPAEPWDKKVDVIVTQEDTIWT